MRIEQGRYIADVDVTATRKAYESLPELTDDCGCESCRNYLAALDHAPAELVAYLSELGVDIRKPAEMSRYDVKNGSKSQYGGFFHLAGAFSGGKFPDVRPSDEDFTFRIGGSTLFFDPQASLIKEGFPRPVLQLEVFLWLPWVLQNAPPERAAE